MTQVFRLLLLNFKGILFYFKSFIILNQQKGKDLNFPFGRFLPIFWQRFSQSGKMSGHYFHQDLHVAKRIYTNNPEKHLDIGSRIDGFISHLAVFRKVEVLDIRNLDSKINNIVFKQADLMQSQVSLYDYCDSISSLHAIEHFGLGRYGDRVDYLGHLKALKNIAKILKKGGVFYFSVPIGLQRIEFNAHRVFSLSYLIQILEEDFDIVDFSFVDDKGDLNINISLNQEGIIRNYGCNYGCGIFELIKK
jgi:SAM-dependent methyltransferase|tara:strand:+ start:47 stop:793 length:747 start_codon:yes stop_codon:yes gene_type:complete